jgi:predicted ATPase
MALHTAHGMLSAEARNKSLQNMVNITEAKGNEKSIAENQFGTALRYIARLLALAHGGQILLSSATYTEIIAEDVVELEETITIGQHKHITVKDLGRRSISYPPQLEHIFQVVAPDLKNDFPPLRETPNFISGVPVAATPFTGREEELSEVTALLQQAEVRLVTLTGTSGTGKTRLGLEIASRLSDQFKDGVFFILLGLLPSFGPAQLFLTLARQFGIGETDNTQPLVEQLKEFLRDKNTLLVLDHFEPLRSASEVLLDFLAVSSGLKILIINRTSLQLPGEHEYKVARLKLPDLINSVNHEQTANTNISANADTDSNEQAKTPAQSSNSNKVKKDKVEALSHYSAIELFVQRAQTVKADFAITEENIETVAEICTRLEGIPLAIELAAVWSNLFSAQALLSQIERLRFDQNQPSQNLIHGEDIESSKLHATLDWSYNLLESNQKLLLIKLSVFASSFDMDAATKVCNYGKNCESELKVLVEHNLLQMVQQAAIEISPMLLNGNSTEKEVKNNSVIIEETTRYILPEIVYEYAREQLKGVQGEGQLRRQHAWYYLDMAEEGAEALRSSQQIQWLHRLEADYDNLRAALVYGQLISESDHEAELCLRLATALGRFWEIRGYLSEGLELVTNVLRYVGEITNEEIAATTADESINTVSLTAEQLPLRIILLKEQARVLQVAGRLNYLQGHYNQAKNLLEKSIQLQRKLEDKPNLLFSLNALGNLFNRQGEFGEASMLFSESLALSYELKDNWVQADTLNNLGLVALFQNKKSLASYYYTASLPMWEKLGDRRGYAMTSSNLGMVAYSNQEYKLAQMLHEQSQVLWQELGDRYGLAHALQHLGQIAYVHQDYRQARIFHQESLMLRRELGDRWGIARSLCSLGAVALSSTDLLTARTLLEESLQLRTSLKDRSGQIESLVGMALVNIQEVATNQIDCPQQQKASQEQTYQYFKEALLLSYKIGMKAAVLHFLENWSPIFRLNTPEMGRWITELEELDQTLQNQPETLEVPEQVYSLV